MNISPTRTIMLLLAASSLLHGCAILPRSEYVRPETHITAQWREQTVTGEKIANQDRWWKNFNDPTLDDLIDRALRTNNDLAAAAIKVRRARLQSQLTNTNLTPSLEVSTSGIFEKELKGGSGSQNYQISGTVSYELDLWGRLARLREAGRWEAEATEADRRKAALTLIGTVAADYWQVAFLNQRITLAEEGVSYALKTLDLAQVRRKAGAVSELDVVQAERNLATRKAELASLVQQREEARNALAVLFDQPPQNRADERSQLPEGPLPDVAAGIPADLLGQRPDLQAAELRLRESLAQTDAVRASFYPTLSLTGSTGTASTNLTEILKNPVASLGIGLALPFLQWNTTKLTIKVAETEYREAVVNFRQNLYQALLDVENALSARVQLNKEKGHREQALASALRAEKIAASRYRAGAVDLQTLLDAQDERRDAEITLAENRLSRLNNRMTLYLALGGDRKSTGSD